MLKSMLILYLYESCLVSVRNMDMSYVILNIWVLTAVVLLTSVKRMDLHHGLITACTGQAHASISAINMIRRARTIFHCPFVLILVVFRA